MPLTTKPFRRRDLPVVGPLCVCCGEGIRIYPKWQTQGFMHDACRRAEEAKPGMGTWPTEADRKALHAQYMLQQGKEVNWYEDESTIPAQKA